MIYLSDYSSLVLPVFLTEVFSQITGKILEKSWKSRHENQDRQIFHYQGYQRPVQNIKDGVFCKNS